MEIKHFRRTAGLSAGLSLVLVATLTGCTEAPVSEAQPTTTSTSSVSPTQPEPTPTFVLEQVQKFDLGDREAWPLALTSTEVLAPVTSIGGTEAQQVWLLDLATGEQTVVARTQWPSGAIGRVAASGGWIVWVDMSLERTDTGTRALLWNIWAKNPGTGQQILLDTDGSAPGAWPETSAPQLVAGDGYIGWAKPGDAGFVQQLIWQPGWETPKTLPLQLQGFDGASAIVDGSLIFERRSDDHWGQEQGLGDCWSYPIDGSSAPEQLTQSGLVQKCTMVGADLVWTEHIDPTADKALVAKVGDLPYLLMAMNMTDLSEPQIVHQGIMKPVAPVAGTDFTWWSSGGRPVISSLTSAAELQVKNADHGFSFLAAADGPLLAYQLRRKDGSTVISVVNVVEQLVQPSSTGISPTSPPAS